MRLLPVIAGLLLFTACSEPGVVDPDGTSTDPGTDPSTAPDTRITGSPESGTFDRYATLEFDSPDGADGFECRLGDAAWEPCTSPHTLINLPLGTQRFAVRATASGEADPTPAEATWDIVSIFDSPVAPVANEGTFPGPSTEGGAFRIQCAVSHFAYDDPIVSPGTPGASHLHMFLGNEESNFSSTIESMFTTGTSTCHGEELNRTSYWVPALLAPEFDDQGQMRMEADGSPELRVVLPLDGADSPHIYYKASTDDPSETQPMPFGLRMIVGDAHATGPQPDALLSVRWWCESWTITSHEDYSAHIPRCDVGDEVNLFVSFPSCWNGEDLDSHDHKSHMARTTFTAGRGLHCPDSHPVPVPTVSYTIFFPVTAELAGPEGDSRWWRIASDSYEVDPETAPGGYSLHADWFMAWHPEAIGTAVERCIAGGRDCSGGQLGNGWRLGWFQPADIRMPDDIRQGSSGG